MQSYLNNNREFFYNHLKEPNYIVSSGSLKLDAEMGGGIRPGVIRFTGVTEGGKSNCALSFARNFLNTVENSYVVYFRAEGRLTDDVINRQGLLNHPRFQVVKGNVYEKVIGLIADLVNNNTSEAKYFFVIDSADAMVPLGDLAKEAKDANKVAGGAVLSSDLLRRMANKFIAFGHICIIISQKREQISISQYKPSDPRITNASGGNALLHYSDWILEFQHRFFGNLITSESGGHVNILGHNCKVIFRKSPNEKSFKPVEYPIRYGATNGKSIWLEREIVDVMLEWNLLKKTSEKSAWLAIADAELVLLKEASIDVPEKFHGEEQAVTFLEQNPHVVEYLYKRLFTVLKK